MTRNIGNLRPPRRTSARSLQRCRVSLRLVGLLAAMLAGGHAHAADQGITGKKLLLKSSNKLVLLSKDASISIAGSDPIDGADSSISFDDGSGPVTFALPKTLWSTNGGVTLFKYKNADAPAGPSEVKIAKIKPGLLKVVAYGLPFPVANGAATIDVVLSLDGGTNSYCMTFSGTGDGSEFLVKDVATGSCTPPATCGNNVQEGTEICDGIDWAACPGDCLPDCTCAQACPTTGGAATVCGAPIGPCVSCCLGNINCFDQCSLAGGASCTDESLNDACNAAANAAGCADECCPVCGNGVAQAPEQCDPPGNTTECDGNTICDTSCACPPPPLVCGDGLIVAPEQCDPPGNTTQCAGNTTCDSACNCPPPPPACADSFPACDGTCPTGGGCISLLTLCVCEGGDCVGGAAPPTCGGTCPPQYECQSFPADCACLQPVCGDGAVFGSEECDPPGNTPQCAGNTTCGPSCTCEPAQCGNNVREGTEECDGTDVGACANGCQANCTCTLPCGDSPACDGTCAPGGNCVSVDGGCVCFAGLCGTQPMCGGGSCPVGYSCVPSILGSDCICIEL